MDAGELIEQVRKAKKGFGVTCRKFAGAVAVEILRAALLEEGIPVSRRDCFVRGLPSEIDLLVIRLEARPAWDFLYEPADVRAVLEVKQLGAFPDTIATVGRLFQEITAGCPDVACAYVALEERKGYRQAVTAANIKPHSVFTLAEYAAPDKPTQLKVGEWERLLAFLRKRIAA